MTRKAALRFASDESDWINGYGLALGTFYTELLINKIYDDFEAQLKDKDERIKELDCRAYHAEGYISDLHNEYPKHKKFLDTKARSIVAMLFWEHKKAKRVIIDFNEKYAPNEAQADHCFKRAYKMLKEIK